MYKTLEARDSKSEGKFESLSCLPLSSHIVGVLERFNHRHLPSEFWAKQGMDTGTRESTIY